MIPNFRPLLAANSMGVQATIEKLLITHEFLYSSFKYDGIRALTFPPTEPKKTCSVKTRALKPLPNRHVRDYMERHFPPFLDGELTLYANSTFNDCQSAFMSHDALPMTWEFCVFDNFEKPHHPFFSRNRRNEEIFRNHKFTKHLLLLNQQKVRSPREIETAIASAKNWNYEGVIFRSPLATYKFGRATLSGAEMVKFKPLETDEAVIVGFEEEMENLSSPLIDERGYTKRLKRVNALKGKETLGSLIVSWRDKVFSIGSGFTQTQRITYWQRRKSLIGRTITFAYQLYGTKNKPRQPIFKGFRHADDL